MHSRPQRRHHMLVVQVGRCQDLDNVEICLSEHLVEALEALLHAHLLGQRLGLVKPWAGEGDQLAPVVTLVTCDIEWCDVADPRYPDPQAIHCQSSASALRPPG